jgi:hypothetical protein
MARLQSGSSTTDRRGRVGGAVISSNAVGWYIKAFVPPFKSRSEAQAEARAVFRTVANAWRGLTESQVDDWNTLAADPDYARLDWWGDPYQLTGFALFTSCNIVRLGMGLTISAAAPEDGFPATPPLCAFLVNSTEPGAVATYSNLAAFGANTYRLRIAAFMQWELTPQGVSSPPLLLGYYEDVYPSSGSFLAGVTVKFGNIPRRAVFTLSVCSVSEEGLVSPPQLYRITTQEP